MAEHDHGSMDMGGHEGHEEAHTEPTPTLEPGPAPQDKNHFPAVSGSEMWHGLAMTALVWGVFPYCVHLAKHKKHPLLQAGLSAVSLLVLVVSGLHMFIFQVARGRPPSPLHGLCGWSFLFMIAAFNVNQLLATRESLREYYDHVVCKHVQMYCGLALFFAWGPLIWVYGVYETTGVLVEEFNQAGGHIFPGGGMIMMGALYMFGPVDEMRRAMFEAAGLCIGGFLYFFLDTVVAGALDGGIANLNAFQHLTTSACWMISGFLGFALWRTGNQKLTGIGMVLGIYAHVMMLLNHPNHNHGMLSVELHKYHAYCIMITGLCRALNMFFLSGVFFVFSGMVFIASQAGWAVPVGSMGIHSSVYLLFILAIGMTAISWFSFLFAHTANEVQEEEGRTKASRGGRHHSILTAYIDDSDVEGK